MFDTVTVDGVTKSVTEWARENKLSIEAIRMRLRNGWTVEKAVSTPVSEKRLRDKAKPEVEKKSKKKKYRYVFEHFTSHSGAYVKKEIE